MYKHRVTAVDVRAQVRFPIVSPDVSAKGIVGSKIRKQRGRDGKRDKKESLGDRMRKQT